MPEYETKDKRKRQCQKIKQKISELEYQTSNEAKNIRTKMPKKIRNSQCQNEKPKIKDKIKKS